MMTRRDVLTLAAGSLVPAVLRIHTHAQELTPVDFAMLARRRALEATRRLASEGWKVRDALLSLHLEPRAIHLSPIHLIGGVEYVFVGTIRPMEGRLQMRLLDEDGLPLATALPDQHTKMQAIWHNNAATRRALLELSVPWDAAAGDLAALYVYR
ncbi:MAG: hypothetical protein ACKV19_17145 [Verrucomicrobiales bacterium]